MNETYGRYDIRYHPEVATADLPKLSSAVQDRIRRSVEERLLYYPDMYSVPLRNNLKGYRKLRVGDYRVVFRIDRSVVMVLVIGHRRDVYERAKQKRRFRC